MESSPTHLSGSKKRNTTMFRAMNEYRSPRRIPSSSSSSSPSLSSCSSSFLSSDHPDHYVSSPIRPATPLRFSGVPFSWEHVPGIPKEPQYGSDDKELYSSLKRLPQPPPKITEKASKKFNVDDSGIRHKRNNSKGQSGTFPNDPFHAALVECSKDDDQESMNGSFGSSGSANKAVSRSLSGRFGLTNLYTSCKSTGAISASIIHLPRPSRTAYDLINSRRSR